MPDVATGVRENVYADESVPRGGSGLPPRLIGVHPAPFTFHLGGRPELKLVGVTPCANIEPEIRSNPIQTRWVAPTEIVPTDSDSVVVLVVTV